MRRYKLRVGVAKEYEKRIGRDRVGERCIFYREMKWFDEKTFVNEQELNQYKQAMYPDMEEFVFEVVENV